MGTSTKIEWTEATWNPVTGCGPEFQCYERCYARRMATRLRGRCGYPANEPFRVTLHPERLAEPLRWKKPRRVFVCSMGDLFHQDVPFEFVDRVMAVAAYRPQHTFQVLTKRPERMAEWFNTWIDQRKRGYLCGEAGYLLDSWHATSDGMGGDCSCALCGGSNPADRYYPDRDRNSIGDMSCVTPWPLPNLWLGTTVENQAAADERIPLLLRCPAAVRFLSMEPLLGPVDFQARLCWPWGKHGPSAAMLSRISLVIAGGESGPLARPSHPDWFRSLRDQCAGAGVAFFLKQIGEWECHGREFHSFEHWVAKASSWLPGLGTVYCMDRLGRHCRIGKDFMRARDEDAFPVSIFLKVGKRETGCELDGREHHKDFPGNAKRKGLTP